MWEIIAVVLAILALAASAVFYFLSAKQLKIAINVFGGFIEGTINGNDVKFRRNKKGDIVGLSVVVHVPTEVVSVGETVLRILKREKKQD